MVLITSINMEVNELARRGDIGRRYTALLKEGRRITYNYNILTQPKYPSTTDAGITAYKKYKTESEAWLLKYHSYLAQFQPTQTQGA